MLTEQLKYTYKRIRINNEGCTAIWAYKLAIKMIEIGTDYYSMAKALKLI